MVAVVVAGLGAVAGCVAAAGGEALPWPCPLSFPFPFPFFAPSGEDFFAAAASARSVFLAATVAARLSCFWAWSIVAVDAVEAGCAVAGWVPCALAGWLVELAGCSFFACPGGSFDALRSSCAVFLAASLASCASFFVGVRDVGATVAAVLVAGSTAGAVGEGGVDGAVDDGGVGAGVGEGAGGVVTGGGVGC